MEKKLTDKQYKKLIEETKDILFGLHHFNRHPTQFLRDVIQAVYGHNVKIEDLIKLIETSELPKER